MSRKSVGIIGAGPGGLVAAKVFLQTKQFDVTVLEKGDRIGGIWALDEQSQHGFLSPQTSTNLSRFTVTFSDLAWSSIDTRGQHWQQLERHSTPIFPKAWQVGTYLEEYRRRYIPARHIHLNTEVLSVEHKPDEFHEKPWLVTAVDRNQERSQWRFDHVIMAAGFFSRPRSITQTISNVRVKDVKVVHSSAFRTLDGLFPRDMAIASKTILMIGGGNSAGETAGAVAAQLSSAQNSADPALRERYKDVSILHIVPRHLYAVPAFVPADESGQHYLPLDVRFFDLSRRSGPIVAGAGRMDQKSRNLLHTVVRNYIGGNQADLGCEALIAPEGDSLGIAQVTISEAYSEFVRSGLIKAVQGRAVSIAEDDEAQATVVLEHEGGQKQVSGIGAVIYATGFSPIPAVDLLDQKTKELLSFDPESLRLPIILEQWQTMNDAIPSLAFSGFYEGPFWGVMEMQARLTASRWLNGGPDKRNAFEARQTMLELRQAMHDKLNDVPQHWMRDYSGLMEEFATALKLKRNDGPLAEREGPVVPPRYLDDGSDVREADIAMQDLVSTAKACMSGKYLARAIFRTLQGKWKLSRKIDSKNVALPSGTVEGIANFHGRSPTPDKTGLLFDSEYLYVESGSFKTDSSAEMNVARSYVYRYSEAKDQLSVWFVKPESPYEVDYLFHDLAFATDDKSSCLAQADHLCVADNYHTEYRFTMKGIALVEFAVQHVVNGPEKDYTMTTTYTRPPKP